IPKIVMNELKMPQPLAGARVQRHERIAEQVLPLAISTVKIVAGRSERNINDAALFIQRHFAPVLNAAYGLPGIRRPSVVSEFTGMRNRVEYPREFACVHVERANRAGI